MWLQYKLTFCEYVASGADQMKIALLGKSGTGKSEVANLWHDATAAEIIQTGAICRQISHILFGNEDKSSTHLIDDRLREIDSSIFLKAAMRNFDTNNAFIIDSLRFRSDYEIATRLACTTVRVESELDIRMQRLEERGQVFVSGRDDAHISEIDLDNVSVDYIIHNNSTRDSLKSDVLRIIRSL